MKEHEMINYLKSTNCYDDSHDFYYEKKMMNTNKTIPIRELVERIIEVDEYFREEHRDTSWNIRQILNNIDMIIPVEDRGE